MCLWNYKRNCFCYFVFATAFCFFVWFNSNFSSTLPVYMQQLWWIFFRSTIDLFAAIFTIGALFFVQKKTNFNYVFKIHSIFIFNCENLCGLPLNIFLLFFRNLFLVINHSTIMLSTLSPNNEKNIGKICNP